MRLERVEAASCRVRLEPAVEGSQHEEADPPRQPAIQLLQCLPKGRKMDLIVRQAVEAGVESVVPVVSERCVVVPDEAPAKRERWVRIAREALQQSGKLRLPSIQEPTPLARAATLGEGDIGLLFHEEPLGAASLHRVLAGTPPGSRICLLIGPEGGLSPREVESLVGAGFRPVFLGETILRTETAALYAVAAVRTILREMGEWTLSQTQ